MVRQKNLTDVKIINRANVLQCICEHPGITRGEIADRLGLTKMSVTNIVSEYAGKKLVREESSAGDPSSRNAGRPFFRIYPEPESIFVLCISISETELTCALADFACRPMFVHSALPTTKETNEQLLSSLDALADQVLADCGNLREKIAGIGISTVGLIDYANGRIIAADNFPGLRNLEAGRHFSKRYGLPVRIANDMDASAMAERHYGRAVGIDNFVYMGVNSCIGLGLYINGALYRGCHGYSGEIGYTTINYMGNVSPFGHRGRLESYVRIDRYEKKVNEELKEGIPGLGRFQGKGMTWKDIVEQAKKGNAYCRDIIFEIGEYISIAVVNVSNLFDPEKIVLGGRIALAGDLIRDYVLEHTRGHSLAAHFVRDENVPLELSAFEGYNAIAGAGAIIFDAIFHGELSVL